MQPAPHARTQRLVLLSNRRKIKHAQHRPSSSQSTNAAVVNNADIGSSYLKTLKDLSTDNEAIANTEAAVGGSEEEQTQLCSPRVGHTVLDKLHNPFLEGDPNLTQRQLGLIHTYMHDLAPMTFGVPREAVYFPAAVMTHLCLRHSDAGSLWTAILADEMIHALSGQPRTTAMALQKAAGHRALQMALRNHQKDFQAAFIGLVKAAQVSLWFGDTKTQDVQGVAAELLIQSVGGLKNALALAPDLDTIYIATPFIWARARFFTRHGLEQTSVRFLQSVQRMLGQDKSGHRRPFRGGTNDLLTEETVSEEYLSMEAETIKLCEPYVARSAGLSNVSRKFRLSLLIELCSIFVEFSSQPDAAVETFKRMIHLFYDSLPPSTNKRQLELRTAALAPMVCHVRRKVLAAFLPGKGLDSDLRITEMGIDGMKVFEYLAHSEQEQILAKLYAWFTHLPDESEPFMVKEVDALKSVVVKNWSARHRKPG